LSYVPTFDDWLALLGVRTQFLDTFQGARQIGETEDDLFAARETWPGVDQDYVDVLDQATEVVVTLRETVAEQADWLDKLRDEVRRINALQEHVFVHDPPDDPDDRLLNRTELDAVQRVLEKIDEAVGAIENAPTPDDEDDWGDDGDDWGNDGDEW
jgi:hypothetical protein